jgi:PDZ domain
LVLYVGINMDDVHFFYNQLNEVVWASDSLVETLTEVDQDYGNDWNDYYEEKVKLGVATLENRSQIAYIGGLILLNELELTVNSSEDSLKNIANLEPRQVIDNGIATDLLSKLSQDAKEISTKRTELVSKGEELLATSLREIETINEELIIKPTDTWDIVVSKAISLRMLGRITDAIDAFTKYEEMFSESDSSARQYAHIARQFTLQMNELNVIDGAVYIFAILEGSAADQNGLQIGDIVVKVNGEAIRNVIDMQYVLENSVTNQALEIIVLRLDKRGVFMPHVLSINNEKPLGISYMPI